MSPLAEAQDLLAPPLPIGPLEHSLPDSPSNADAFVASASGAGQHGPLRAESLLALLAPAHTGGSDFASWFAQHFDSSAALRERLVKMNRLNSSLMREWADLLAHSWPRSEYARVSPQFVLH